MKTGFDFFKTQDPTEQSNIDKLELKHGLNLPPLFKLFCRTFVVGEEKLAIDKFLDNSNNPLTLGSAVITSIENETVYLNGLMGLNSIFQQWEGSKFDVEWKHYQLIRIGYLGQVGFGGLYVGCGLRNSDEIWRFNADAVEKFTKLNNNIFEFVMRLRFSYDFSNLDESSYSHLYKNWGDEFWRIK